MDFDKEYFSGHLKNVVGSFTQKCLTKNVRWYSGWLRYLHHLGALSLHDPCSVLEVGCSIGAVSHLLNQNGFKVVATDVSSYAVDKARNLSPFIEFRVWDCHEEFMPKKQFDAVIAFEVVEHLSDPEKAMRNICSVLCDKGKFIFSTPFPCPKAYDDPTHVNVRDPSLWEEALLDNGFRSAEFFHVSFLPMLYRWGAFFSRVIPIGCNMRGINSTMIFIAVK